MSVVEVNRIFKSYTGKDAVIDLSFSVDQGEILGLIGPNGAGKSTTIKIILDFIKPDSGDVKIFGSELTEENKNKLGYLPEERGLYQRLTVIGLIIYLATLKGISRKQAEKKADELLDLTDMRSSRNKKIEEMSKGMAQIIQFIVTIIHSPELIILDEPFSGLDPVNTDLIKRILNNLRGQGKAIILSTHQMNEVEAICNRVLMINNGRLVLYGNISDIRSKYRSNSVLVDVEGDIGEIPGVIEKRNRRNCMEFILEKTTQPQQILEGLIRQGKIINRFELGLPSLNEIFLKAVTTNE